MMLIGMMLMYRIDVDKYNIPGEPRVHLSEFELVSEPAASQPASQPAILFSTLCMYLLVAVQYADQPTPPTQQQPSNIHIHIHTPFSALRALIVIDRESDLRFHVCVYVQLYTLLYSTYIHS